MALVLAAASLATPAGTRAQCAQPGAPLTWQAGDTQRVRGAIPAAPDSTGGVPQLAASDSTPGTPSDSAIVPPVRGLDGLTIRTILILPHTIYDPCPPGRLAMLYRMANRLHVRTRRSTIRSQLLFRPGDRWSEARARELARNLRSSSFLLPVRIEPDGDGDSVDVWIETRDLWTTSPEFNFESSGGRRYGAIAFTDRNLAGLGKSLSFSWRHDPVGISRYVSYWDPDVYGSHARMQVVSGRGSDGASTRAMLSVPFWALDVRRSYGASFQRTTSNAVFYERASEVARINRRLEETELWWGHGGWTDSLIRRFTYTLRLRDKRLGPTVAASSMPVPTEFMGAESSRRLRRLEAEMRLWRPNFIERTDVEEMGTTEDFDVGKSCKLGLGYAPSWFGGRDEGYGRLQLDGGLRAGSSFGLATGSVETRPSRLTREVLLRMQARWYQRLFAHQMLVLATEGDAGWNTDRDYQLVVGGLNGLRAYAVQALAGRRMWRLNAEQRTKITELFGDMLSVGAVAFTDGARMLGPGASGTGWFVDSGIGLRMTAPQWTFGRVLRIDVAWPVTPTRDGRRQPVVSFGSSQAF